MFKTIRRIYQQKRIEAEKFGDKDGKAFYKLIKKAMCGKKLKTWEIESM